VVRGDIASRAFSVVYLRDGRVIALDCVNIVRDYVQGRALVSGRQIVSPIDLTNTSVPLKDLAAIGAGELATGTGSSS
jgi:3-phenylpropionate/trans-cinnamate dioxygenase ferredoxin reductase subunit